MKRLFSLLVLALLFVPLNAEIRLPSLIGDNMVLQQNANVRIWGWSFPHNTITLSATWLNQSLAVKSDKTGYWEVVVPTPKADHQSHALLLNDGTPLTVYNILMGEVWVTGGQSNMKFPIGGIWDTPCEGGNEAIAQCVRYPEIRCFTVDERGDLSPQNDCGGRWEVSTEENVQDWGAVGYFYSRALHDNLNVPIGIINSSFGGTIIEAWMAEEDLKKYDDVDYTPLTDNTKFDFTKPFVRYNSMLYPLTNYTIRGFLFYQGCSNVWTAATYADKLCTMVKRWRKDWRLGDLPFYYVQIAPFDYGDNVQGAIFREQQQLAQGRISNSGMITIYDLCYDDERFNAHPRRKKEVGERLAYMALAKTYGKAGICTSYPEYSSMKVDGDKVYVSIDIKDGRGLYPWTDIKGFELAGADGVFHEANGFLQLSTREIVLTSPDVMKPVHVRYCFKNFPFGNVTNLRGLPLLPFRTDKY